MSKYRGIKRDRWGLKVKKKKKKNNKYVVFRPFKIQIQIFDKPRIESGRETCCAKNIVYSMNGMDKKFQTPYIDCSRIEQCVDRGRNENFRKKWIEGEGGFRA